MAGRTATSRPRPPAPTPGETARAEAVKYRGVGKSEIARGHRRRRVWLYTARLWTAPQIAEATGWPLKTIEEDQAALRKEYGALVSTWDLKKDMETQLARFDQLCALFHEHMAFVGPGHRNGPRYALALLELEKLKNAYLERMGKRKPVEEGGPPDAQDLRGLPTHVIEIRQSQIVAAFYQRLDPNGYLRAREAMRQGDVIDVPVEAPALPEGDEKE